MFELEADLPPYSYSSFALISVWLANAPFFSLRLGDFMSFLEFVFVSSSFDE
jgi:hypothetical protein